MNSRKTRGPSVCCTVFALLFGSAARGADSQAAASTGDATAAADGPNISFCELYQLTQFGRSGDTVGLAATTTSWNVGTHDAHWYPLPETQHPFIAQNVYRLKNDRFEQIGESWVKHGFYALSGEQCNTSCTYEAGHSEGRYLGVGCTDTYDAFLNADRNTLGPRSEINPWTGGYAIGGSHLSTNHSHNNGILHRLQVKDADLNPSQNSGAAYYLEGYYVHLEDVNVMDSAAWRTITITSGAPGGNWNFDSGNFDDRPNIGFAIDAWTGARQTVIAQEVPPIEGTSPDGRCILAAKASDLGGGTWHFEYALLNIDMNRKVGSFSVPLPPNTTVTNVGFHAPLSHNEPYDNLAWTPAQSSNSLTWTTVNNPCRWGTVYNFRFDANYPPGDVMATLGLFTAGSPNSVVGVTTGPAIQVPAVSQWGLIVLGLAMLSGGAAIYSKRTTRPAATVTP